MQIRSADPNRDAAACVEIYTPFVTDSVVSFDEVPPSVEEFAAKIAKLSDTHEFLVAETGNKVSGYAYAGPYRERVAYRWATEVSVYVHPDHRHEGVGAGLYRELLKRLRDKGFRIAIAGITQPNDASMALHMSLGFTQVGIFQRIGFKLGAWQDVAFLQLELAPDAGPPTT
ncbi:MAG: N-acetyltransferase [Solirubrobacterales bacterium]|nr:N-acetyltransferase [Solirubrobacterales bacterium]